MRVYLKYQPGRKERVGYGRQLDGGELLFGIQTAVWGRWSRRERFERIVQEIRLKVWVGNRLQPDVGLECGLLLLLSLLKLKRIDKLLV